MKLKVPYTGQLNELSTLRNTFFSAKQELGFFFSCFKTFILSVVHSIEISMRGLTWKLAYCPCQFRVEGTQANIFCQLKKIQ